MARQGSKKHKKPAEKAQKRREFDGPPLTENALKVLAERYFLPKADGTLETVDDLFGRVATAVASVEKKNRSQWEEAYFRLMRDMRFLPNSPTLMNAGRKNGQLSACYVLPIGDSLEDIFGTLKDAAIIHQSGGGTGFSFSHLRPAGAPLSTSRGTASGPVSFLRVFDQTTEAIKQGGARRGANMGILKVDHPDVLEFIRVKRDGKSVTNFNLSIAVTDDFFSAVEQRKAIDLKDPRTNALVRTMEAKELFHAIIENAWASGDPGLIFIDRVNLFNPTPKEGDMESTNPCGEQPLLAYESCNLGSLNLTKYADPTSRSVHWKDFRTDVRLATRFLDNVIDANVFPLVETKKITKKNRKIGLGIMGLADLFLMLGIPYDTQEALDLGEKIMSVLDREAKAASRQLAKERGAFPNWKGSMWEKLGYPKMRNATVSTVAPTGTISVIAGVSSGIEPIFAPVFVRNVLDGKKLHEVHPLKDKVDPKVWRTTLEVPVGMHIEMQARFQRHSDSAVSKTINLSEFATPEDIERAYLLAYHHGCKGITIFRDRSKPTQVLERPEMPKICDVCES